MKSKNNLKIGNDFDKEFLIKEYIKWISYVPGKKLYLFTKNEKDMSAEERLQYAEYKKSREDVLFLKKYKAGESVENDTKFDSLVDIERIMEDKIDISEKRSLESACDLFDYLSDEDLQKAISLNMENYFNLSINTAYVLHFIVKEYNNRKNRKRILSQFTKKMDFLEC